MKNRIKELRNSRGLSQEELAAMVEAHFTTINKLETGKQRLSDPWVEKISTALGVSPGALYDDISDTRLVPVRGHVQAGAWSESHELPPDDVYNIAVPDDPEWRGKRLHAAETRGPSMNKVFPEGTVIVFTDPFEIEQGDIQPGKRYVVEIERADGLREATVKTLFRDDDGHYWLLPESTDPRFSEAIPIDGNEGDMITIKGRVIYSVRRE